MADRKLTGSAIVSAASRAAWKAFQSINKRVPEGKAIHPEWAPRPLLKSYEKSRPPLGFPRRTDSLCPRCVKEVRTAIINGERDLSALVGTHPGEIPADIVEENGRILMKKSCPDHGDFEDVLSISPEFHRRTEDLFMGRDFRTVSEGKIHDHGTSSIKFGRGAVLTVDLTNRCNMMCNPCFMDANQVGYVHEPTLEDIKAILDRGVSFKPRRQAVILFSGGEPTVASTFLDAVRYAKKIGYYRILAATNGIRFAQDLDFAHKAKEAGLSGAYLQFDGATNKANTHRGVSNLFEVKKKAIENIYSAGMKCTLVTTILNGVNNESIGEVVQFAIENSKMITTIAFQPVSFTGRDEDIDDETRIRQRYTLSHLALDLKEQLDGELEPMRDWFPLSSMSAFTSVMDLLQGADAAWGWSACNCHPNCGIFTILAVNRRTKAWAPLYRFFNYEEFIKDIALITDSARGPFLTKAQLMLSILRHFDASKAPEGFPIGQLKALFAPQRTAAKQEEGLMIGKGREEKDDEWGILCLEGMWFQDLFNYDFRRTEMCIIPYGTQEGEISFCAYNTGVGWRQVIENMHKTAVVQEWFRDKGRHPVYAGGKSVPLGADAPPGEAYTRESAQKKEPPPPATEAGPGAPAEETTARTSSS
ncbi:MAG: radical SAM protein [Planctomycetota bacterium]|nr:radical SAM protein [Planctomycetota bacterium]